VADKLTIGPVPVPVKVTVCGLLGASSVTVRVPFSSPVAVGLKVTLMVQVALRPRVAAQVLVWAKSALAVMLEMLRVALPVLERVTDCAGLVVFTA